MMTEQEMQIALAEWDGCFIVKDGAHHSYRNYLHDLNAVHELEKKLKQIYGGRSIKNLHRDYLLQLIEETNPGVKLWSNGNYLGGWSNAIKAAETTALQRCTALCKTLWPEKWKE